MLDRNRILPVIILALLISTALIAYLLGNNDSDKTAISTSDQTGDQQRIDDMKQTSDQSQEGLDEQPDEDNSETPDLIAITRSHLNNSQLKVGAALYSPLWQDSSNTASNTVCLFKIRDQTGLSLESEKEILASNGTYGCADSFDVSKLSSPGDWSIEVQALAASGEILASGVKIIKVDVQ